MELNFIHHDLSYESTDSHSNETKSSTATPPSPGKSIEMIAQYLSHESPVVTPQIIHKTPEKFNESFNINRDQINVSIDTESEVNDPSEFVIN